MITRERLLKPSHKSLPKGVALECFLHNNHAVNIIQGLLNITHNLPTTTAQPGVAIIATAGYLLLALVRSSDHDLCTVNTGSRTLKMFAKGGGGRAEAHPMCSMDTFQARVSAYI